MLNPPRSLEEARKYWIPFQSVFMRGRCSYPIYSPTYRVRQCPRKPGHGPARLYCKRHAKMIEKQDKQRGKA